MDMSWAMNVMELLYCTMAIAAEMTTNTTSSPRMHRSCPRSPKSFTRLPLIRSSVSVEDEVSTSELSVLMEAESTRTITSPTRMSGRPDSIVGMMES